MPRVVGIVLIVMAIGVCLLGSLLLGLAVNGGSLEVTGAVLGIGLLGIFLIAPLAGGGVFVLARSRRDDNEQEQADSLRRILDMVEAKGEVELSDIVIELQSELPAVKDQIYKLVGLGVFDGYINWDQGILYSAEASALHELSQCKHCGGNVDFAGKGVLQCPFCGTEYFLSR